MFEGLLKVCGLTPNDIVPDDIQELRWEMNAGEKPTMTFELGGLMARLIAKAIEAERGACLQIVNEAEAMWRGIALNPLELQDDVLVAMVNVFECHRLSSLIAARGEL